MSGDSLDPFGEDTESDELPHNDERWLVSYADMMTLLFGLFVMLYSMAEHFDDVEKSVRQNFAATKVESTPPPEPVPVAVENAVPLEQKLDNLMKANVFLEDQLKKAEIKLSQLKAPLCPTLPKETVTKALSPPLETAGKEIKALRKERDELRAQVASLRLGGGTTEAPAAAAVAPTPAAPPVESAPISQAGDGGEEIYRRVPMTMTREDGSTVQVIMSIGRDPSSPTRVIEMNGKAPNEFGTWVRDSK